MKILWTFNFNAQCHFMRAEYIFEFEGARYRLIRGAEEESDKLMTLSEEDKDKQNDCLERTRRLLDCLSWEFGVGFLYLGSGGKPIRENNHNFETEKVTSFCKRNMKGLIVDPQYITNISNEVQRFALSLWNESENSNSAFLSFLNYWKILELVPYGKKEKGRAQDRAIGWINRNVNGKKYS